MSRCDFSLFFKRLENGESLGKEEALSVIGAPLDEVKDFSDRIRLRFAPNDELCAIVNGKSGRCSEDCRYCAQSAFHRTETAVYPLKDDSFLDDAYRKAEENGLDHFSVVTSGRSLSGEEVKRLSALYARWSSFGKVKVCCSHGLLSAADFRLLADAGVSRYHCNLETSRRFFPSVCTTHSFDDKINTVRAAQTAGLEVCSGGIFGMGESWEDRIDMALELRALGIRSVPLNFLSPIRGTAFETLPPPDDETACRVFGIFRMLLPSAFLRLAGGRASLNRAGVPLFEAGANAAITGDLLTTGGGQADADRAALARRQTGKGGPCDENAQ